MNGIRGNVIVGQSGGPTAVINSSLAGVFKNSKRQRGKIRCTVCSTVSRDFYRRDMWI